MPKINCDICMKSLKPRFFSLENQQAGKKVCIKCFTKNKKINERMFNEISRTSDVSLSPEDRQNISLSIETQQELKQKTKDKPETVELLKKTNGVSDRLLIREVVRSIGLSQNSSIELENHLVTLGKIQEATIQQKINQEEQQDKHNETALNDSILNSGTLDSGTLDNDEILDDLKQQAIDIETQTGK
jgi:hypothetical protein